MIAVADIVPVRELIKENVTVPLPALMLLFWVFIWPELIIPVVVIVPVPRVNAPL